MLDHKQNNHKHQGTHICTEWILYLHYLHSFVSVAIVLSLWSVLELLAALIIFLCNLRTGLKMSKAANIVHIIVNVFINQMCVHPWSNILAMWSSSSFWSHTSPCGSLPKRLSFSHIGGTNQPETFPPSWDQPGPDPSLQSVAGWYDGTEIFPFGRPLKYNHTYTITNVLGTNHEPSFAKYDDHSLLSRQAEG